MNEKYSYKNFTGESFVLVDPAEFNNTEIIGSCFCQENVPDTDVFPAITGVTFRECNLTNVKIPIGNTVINCSMLRVIAQNDGENWFVDSGNKPLAPVHPAAFDKLKLSTNPNDIPPSIVLIPITIQKEQELINVREIIDGLKSSLTNTLSLSDELLLKKTYGISDAEVALIKEQIA